LTREEVIAASNDTIRLRCIADLCPDTGEHVDFRQCRCCQHYLGQNEFGTVDCGHADAGAAPEELRAKRVRHGLLQTAWGK